MSLAQRRQLVDRDHRSLPIARQCALLGVSRSGLYYRPKGTSDNDLSLMQAMDRQYLETPFCGSRRMRAWLGRQGKDVNRKRVQRLMRIMDLRAIYRRPRTSRPAPGQPVFPICWSAGKSQSHWPQPAPAPDPRSGVWAADITYLPGASCTWSPSLPRVKAVRGGSAVVQHPPIGVEGRLWRRTSASRR